MAAQAAAPVIRDFFLRIRQHVRIVAGNASELALAAAKALAGVDLFGVAPRGFTIGELIGLNSIREWAAGYVAAAGRVSQFARDYLSQETEATLSPTLPNPSTATP